MGSFFHPKKVFIILSALFAFPFFVSANTLGISPSVGSYQVGKTFPVNVYVTSTAEPVNAISGNITFPVDKLQVVSISKTSSILSLWVTEPTYSNNAGTINFEGVVPNPGFQGSAGRIITINFKVIGKGDAVVKFSSAQLLANDGNGTNILKNLNSASFTFDGVQAITPPPAVTPISLKVPSAPVVTSLDYPVQNDWYQNKSGSFSWQLSPEITSVRLAVSKEPIQDGTVVYTPPIGSKQIAETDDGIWYFHVQVKNSSGWSQPAHYMFRIDTTPPENFLVNQVISADATEPRPSFNISATDLSSGVSQYSIQIDSLPSVVWQDDGTSIYKAPVLGPGMHTLVAKAFDYAGNFSISSTNFSITGIETPVITSYTEEVSSGSPVKVSGTSAVGNSVKLIMRRPGLDDVVEKVLTDNSGKFSGKIDGDKLSSGAYKLLAVAIDTRGAESEPTQAMNINVKVGWFSALGEYLTSFFSIMIPIFALLFTFIVLVFYGYNKIKAMRRKVALETPIEDRALYVSLSSLRADIRDSVYLLERAKIRRKLTQEEELILERLKQNFQNPADLSKNRQNLSKDVAKILY